MGIFEFLILCVVLVLLAAFAIWVMNYFAPSAVPPFIPKVIWGVVIFVLIVILAQATGLVGHDVAIPRLR